MWKVYFQSDSRFFNELLVEAYQLGRQIDLIRGNPPELKCFQGFFSQSFQCHIVRCSALKAFSRCGIDMAHDQVDIPLGKELKICLFRQNHPEHGMRLLQTAFLPAAHRVAVIDTGTLDPCKPGFQRFGITKLRAPVGKNVFKQCLKIISTKGSFTADVWNSYKSR